MNSSCLLALALVYIVSCTVATPVDEQPFDCPANEKYYKCSLEACYTTCKHLKQPPPCAAIAPGCYKPACLCDGDLLRNDDGVCVPKDRCYYQEQ